MFFSSTSKQYTCKLWHDFLQSNQLIFLNFLLHFSFIINAKLLQCRASVWWANKRITFSNLRCSMKLVLHICAPHITSLDTEASRQFYVEVMLAAHLYAISGWLSRAKIIRWKNDPKLTPSAGFHFKVPGIPARSNSLNILFSADDYQLFAIPSHRSVIAPLEELLNRPPWKCAQLFLLSLMAGFANTGFVFFMNTRLDSIFTPDLLSLWCNLVCWWKRISGCSSQPSLEIQRKVHSALRIGRNWM